MSHTVQINYQALAIQCQSICETAERSLIEMKSEIDEIDADSSSVLNDETAAVKASILKEIEDLLNRIASYHENANVSAAAGRGADRNLITPQVLQTVRDLVVQANSLSTTGLIRYRSLLSSTMADAIKEDERRRREFGSGAVTAGSSTQKLLDSIEDEVLRQFTYIAYLRDNSLDGENLIAAGRTLMDESVNMTYEQRREAEKKKIRRELEAMRLDKSKVDEILSKEGLTAKEQIETVKAVATEEIVGEKVRQKSIKIIMSAIQDRGFIVDKKNMRINRDSNEVTLVALKASGEKAEFRVFLDGKFIYDFRGYEGQACQKDIEPFMNDLEEIYGMHVTETKEIWKNPDKISTMKYQTYKTNKNTD